MYAPFGLALSMHITRAGAHVPLSIKMLMHASTPAFPESHEVLALYLKADHGRMDRDFSRTER